MPTVPRPDSAHRALKARAQWQREQAAKREVERVRRPHVEYQRLRLMGHDEYWAPEPGMPDFVPPRRCE